MAGDPVQTNPELYRTVFENDRVRVLEYLDQPGARTVPHWHPDSVMVTLSSFRRRLEGAGDTVDVELPAGVVRWLDAQEHAGENIGETETRVLLIELRETPIAEPSPGESRLGPSQS